MSKDVSACCPIPTEMIYDFHNSYNMIPIPCEHQSNMHGSEFQESVDMYVCEVESVEPVELVEPMNEDELNDCIDFALDMDYDW
jgi:hypothetical protein